MKFFKDICMRSEMFRKRPTLRSSTTRRRIISLPYLLMSGLALLVVGYLAAFHAAVMKRDGSRIATTQQQEQPQKEAVKSLRQNPVKKAPVNDLSQAITIGFAVTVTGCGSDPITEGAAVLKHSIHLASVHGNLGGRYNYQMYAIYHPDGEQCAAPLKDLGYILVKRETPVAVKDIEGEFLRNNIEKNGCCGEKELVKLEGENGWDENNNASWAVLIALLVGFVSFSLAGRFFSGLTSSPLVLPLPFDQPTHWSNIPWWSIWIWMY